MALQKYITLYLHIHLVLLEVSWSKTSMIHKFEDIEALSNHFDISHPNIIRKDKFGKVKIMKYYSQSFLELS